jgi:hypothetical protein
MKLYTEYEIFGFLKMHHSDGICAKTFMKNLTPVELPTDKEKEEEIQAAYQDGRESVIIEHTAALSTSNANSYSEGYKEGYKRALDYMTDTIKNKIEIKENGSNIFTTANTTDTTFLCTLFVGEPNGSTTNPKCMNCGKEIWQHVKITNTI